MKLEIRKSHGKSTEISIGCGIFMVFIVVMLPFGFSLSLVGLIFFIRENHKLNNIEFSTDTKKTIQVSRNFIEPFSIVPTDAKIIIEEQEKMRKFNYSSFDESGEHIFNIFSSLEMVYQNLKNAPNPFRIFAVFEEERKVLGITRLKKGEKSIYSLVTNGLIHPNTKKYPITLIGFKNLSQTYSSVIKEENRNYLSNITKNFLWKDIGCSTCIMEEYAKNNTIGNYDIFWSRTYISPAKLFMKNVLSPIIINGSRKGYCSLSLVLPSISESFQNQELKGKIVIIDSDEFIFASNFNVSYGNEEYLFRATIHPNDLVSKLSTSLVKEFGEFKKIKEFSNHVVFTSNNLFFVSCRILEKEIGLKLFIFVISPFSNFIISPILPITISVLLLIFAILFSILFSIILSRILAFQFRGLIKRTKLIGNLEIMKDRSVKISNFIKYFTELSKINEAYNKLNHGIDNFSKFLPLEVLKHIFTFERTSNLSQHLRNVETTALFCDIEGFTKISGELEPLELVDYLRAFFNMCDNVIAKKNGRIDKFVGDCTFALWGSLKYIPNHYFKGTSAAIELIEESKKIEVAGKLLSLRAGVNSGTVLSGIIGGINKLSFTSVGSVINQASRLESLNKKYGTRILIGERTYENVKDEIVCLFLDRTRIRGKRRKSNIYEVLSLRSKTTKRNLEREKLHNELRHYILQKEYFRSKKISNHIVELFGEGAISHLNKRLKTICNQKNYLHLKLLKDPKFHSVTI